LRNTDFKKESMRETEIAGEWIGDCFICTSHRPSTYGYPCVTRNGKWWKMSRFIYTQAYGAIPPGLVVRHKCDNRACININHLELGTHWDNVQDKVARGRSAKGLVGKFGKLTEEQMIEVFCSQLPQRVIAEKFGIGKTSISHIKNRHSCQKITIGHTPGFYQPLKRHKTP
jgi:hypothetical protein